MAIARMRRACLASAVRAASARNCEILRSWRVISIADMMPAPRIIDVLHRVTFTDGWESHRSQVLRRLVLVLVLVNAIIELMATVSLPKVAGPSVPAATIAGPHEADGKSDLAAMDRQTLRDWVHRY